MQEDTINITENSLWNFLLAIQDGFKQGYVLSDSNANFPQGFISLYTCNLVKEPVAEVDTVVADVTTEVTKKSAGRPKGSK